MSCPNCGNMDLYALGECSEGWVRFRCGKCGNVFPEAESKGLEFKKAIRQNLKSLEEVLIEQSQTLEELRKMKERDSGPDNDDFEKVYAGYVIRDMSNSAGNFVGPNDDMYRVALRSWAARFTKQQAMEYIKANKGEWRIEDAT